VSCRTGYVGPLSVFGFFILTTVINKFLMSPVVALVFRLQELEGDLRLIVRFAYLDSKPSIRCGTKTYECNGHDLKLTVWLIQV
jgi:hypothetical protein